MLYPCPGVLCYSLTGATKFAGKRMRILQNFQEFRVRVRMSHRTSRNSGYCGTGVQNSQKVRAGTKHAVPVPRVLWPGAYRTSRSSGYMYECRTEVPEVPGTCMNAVRTELPEVPGTGMELNDISSF